MGIHTFIQSGTRKKPTGCFFTYTPPKIQVWEKVKVSEQKSPKKFQIFQEMCQEGKSSEYGKRRKSAKLPYHHNFVSHGVSHEEQTLTPWLMNTL